MPVPYRQQQASNPPVLGPILLYLLPVPLLLVIVMAFAQGHFFRALFGLLALGLFWLAAWFVKRAAFYEWKSRQRKWQRATRIPWRFSAAVFTAGGAFVVTTLLVHHNIFIGALAAVIGFCGILLTYGVDPQHDKTLDTSRFGVTTEEISDLLDEAEANLDDISNAAAQLDNTELKVRLNRIADKTRGILKLIEEDPKDLRRARKFLKVYLQGARQVASQYVKTSHTQQHDELEQNFRNVLGTIEDVIEEQRTKLLENDVLDLDVKIEVLEAQLKHEGVI
ncbi:MAG: 5-bromo-4-chloroindolyl phosphate hydrolysis family protein [Pseudomonadota bacterium]